MNHFCLFFLTSAVLQIDENNFPEAVEQILDILGPDVGRQVANVDAAVISRGTTHSQVHRGSILNYVLLMRENLPQTG